MRQVRLYDDGATANEAGIVGAISRALRPATRVVAVTWVHSGTGVKLPIRAIADALAEENRGRDAADRAVLCVDGVHGIGVEDVSLPALGCDFFVAGAHKWLFGPRGTGFVWGRSEAWGMATAAIPPFNPGMFDPKFGEAIGMDAGRPTPTGMDMTPGGFHSFEHRWALAEAFALHERIGRSRIAERIHALNRRLKEGLAGMPHVVLRTPMDEKLSAGIVCFEVRGMAPAKVVDRLRERKIIASVTPYLVRYARLAAGLMNNEADVDAALHAVRALA